MHKPSLTLYHYWRSSCSWRVRWALALKGVSFHSVTVNILAGEHRGPEHLARSPAGLLPTLEIDGHNFGESLALIEWINETWPEPPLYPKEALERLHCRQLALTIVAGTQPIQNPAVLRYFEADEERRTAHARHWITRGLQAYESLLTSRAPTVFSCGNFPTVSDLCLIPQVYNALRFGVDLERTPRVRTIYEHARSTPACQLASPEAYET